MVDGHVGQGAVLAVDAAHHFVHHAAYEVRQGGDGQETAGALSSRRQRRAAPAGLGTWEHSHQALSSEQPLAVEPTVGWHAALLDQLGQTAASGLAQQLQGTLSAATAAVAHTP